jgi:predicted RecA/RadA family phage recombinase
MSKNYQGAGQTVTFISPTGGTTSGVPLAINSLVVVPMDTTKKGEPCVGALGGSWQLPVTGALKQGAKVSLLVGGLVADGTADAVPFGKLLTDATGGFAEALLIQ